MNILIPESWLREFLETTAPANEISRCLSLCGPSVERIHQTNGENIFAIEITTNRVDCASVLGIAREAAAILPRFGYPAKLKTNFPLTTKTTTPHPTNPAINASIDQSLCPMFLAQIISHVTVQPSPDWLQKKLRLINLKPINNLVDITNLLTHELGQPMHVFDWEKLGNNFRLRLSQQGEIITTLDGETRTLPGNDIVIENHRGELADLCGIMGAKNSAVTPQTTQALLFVQTYPPVYIRKTSMALNLRTQAAVRFEKGLPAQSVIPAANAALRYLTDLRVGTVSTPPLVIGNPNPQPPVIKLPQPLPALVQKLIGVKLENRLIQDILTSLNFQYLNPRTIRVPWYRTGDVQIPEDIIEEIARIYGYHNLTGSLMTGPLPASRPYDRQFYWESRIKYLLKHLGCTETYTYSLTPSDPHPQALKLKNPLSSEWVYLRTTLLPSHLQVMSQNIGLSKSPLTFFELAKVYLPTGSGLPTEQINLIISSTHPDPRHLKGIIENLSSDLGVNVSFSLTRSAYGWSFETPLSNLIESATNIKAFTPISRFNEIVEDYNIRLTEEYASLINQIKLLSPLIKQIELIDIYSDKITIRIHYHSSEYQISDADIAPLRAKISAYPPQPA